MPEAAETITDVSEIAVWVKTGLPLDPPTNTLPVMLRPVIGPVQDHAGRRLAGEVDLIIQERVVHKTARDFDDVVPPCGQGGQRVFHEQLDRVVGAQAHLLADAEPFSGEARVGRAARPLRPQESRRPGPGPVEPAAADALTSGRTSSRPSAETAPGLPSNRTP